MPSAASGETLAERAQRFLGIDLDAWLSGELKSDHRSVSGNRSEQIAHAQRKHRQRTQSYIQALEEELLRLHSDGLALKQEIEKIRSQLQHENDESQKENPVLPIPSESTTETIMIDWGGFYQTAPEAPCCITAAESVPFGLPWTKAGDDVSQCQAPLGLRSNTLSDKLLPEARDISSEEKERASLLSLPKREQSTSSMIAPAPPSLPSMQ